MLSLMKCPYLFSPQMGFSYFRHHMVGLHLTTALITYSIVEEFEEYIVMTNFMHSVIAIFLLK